MSLGPNTFEATEIALDAIESGAQFDLFNWTWIHLHMDPACLPKLLRIRGGHGYRDDALDVIATKRLAQKQKLLEQLTFPYDEAQLDALEVKATAFLDTLNRSRKPVTPPERDLRDRAWSRFLIRYERLVRAARYVMEELGLEGNPVELFLGLSPG